MSEQNQTPEVMITDPKHHAFNDDISKTIISHAQALRPIEMIAILSYAVGALISLLPDELVQNGAALDLVQRNMDNGNIDTNGMLKQVTLLIGKEDEIPEAEVVN
jgi:hypothetical protein